MSNWPVVGAPMVHNSKGSRSLTDGVITAAGLNTKTAWQQVTAATPFRAAALHVSIIYSGSGTKSCLVDIGIGAAGAEMVLVGDLPLKHASFNGADATMILPIEVPEGSRLSFRAQLSSTASVSSNFTVTLRPLPFSPLVAPPLSWVGTFGVDYAASTYTSCTQTYDGDGTGTPSWSELVAATPRPIRALAVGYMGTDSQYVSLWRGISIGIGPAGAEQKVLSEIAAWTATDGCGPQLIGPFDVDIPAGSRLTAAVQSANIALIHKVGVVAFG